MSAERAGEPWWVQWLAGHRKAVAALLGAGLTALGTALADGELSAAEIPGIFLAMLLVGKSVEAITNKGPKANATEVALPPKS